MEKREFWTIMPRIRDRLNVQSDGEYIAKGEKVRVDHVEGARVVVRRIPANG